MKRGSNHTYMIIRSSSLQGLRTNAVETSETELFPSPIPQLHLYKAPKCPRLALGRGRAEADSCLHRLLACRRRPNTFIHLGGSLDAPDDLVGDDVYGDIPEFRFIQDGNNFVSCRSPIGGCYEPRLRRPREDYSQGCCPFCSGNTPQRSIL